MGRCFSMAVLLSLSASIFADEVGGFRPEVGRFPQTKYEQFSLEPRLRGYFIADSVVTPTRDWIVFTVESNMQNPEQAVVVGIVAYQLSSGNVRHLQFSSAVKEQNSDIHIADGAGFIPLGDNRLMFLTELSQTQKHAGTRSDVQKMDGVKWSSDDQSSDVSHEYHFWEWDLSTDNVCLRREKGDDVPIRVATAVRLGPCELSWSTSSNADSAGGRLGVSDKRSGKSATVGLELGCRASMTNSQTYAATGDPCAFAVCNPRELDSAGTLDVSCIDPNAPEGIRWRIEKTVLDQHTMGGTIVGAAFLDNSFDPAPELFLMLLLADKNDEKFVVLLRIDATAGRIDRQYKLPLGSPEPEDLVLSPSKRMIVARVSTSDELSPRYRVIELESGRFRDTNALDDWNDTLFTRLVGFVNEKDVAIAGKHAIYVLETTGQLQQRELFRLNKYEDD